MDYKKMKLINYRFRRKNNRRQGFPDQLDKSYPFHRPVYSGDIHATITGIEWERFYLFLDLEVEGAVGTAEFFLVTNEREGLVGGKFKLVERDGSHYRVVLDLTNDGHHHCVRPETYFLYVLDESDHWNEVMLDYSIGYQAPSWSRVFPYNAAKQEYIVFFDLNKFSSSPVPIIRIFSVSRYETDIRDRKDHKLYEVIRDGYPSEEFKRAALVKYYETQHALHKRGDKPTVLFVSEQDDHLRSNLKAVHDRMIERGLDEQFDIQVACREAAAFGHSKLSWLKILKRYANADYLFVDDHNPVFDWIPIGKKTQVVQLWHAGAGFKAAGYARWGRTGAPRPFSAHRQYSYGISGSRKIASFFSEVFGINEERILPLGMPRMDEYLDPAYRTAKTAELYDRYPMAKGKKVILFAPTYRGINKPQAMYPYDMIDFDELYDLCGDEWVVFFKMHPWVHDGVPIKEEHADRFLDAGKYPNINDLFYITELLITDYSSNIFEFSLMRKPMLFYAFDEVEYAFMRGFHRPFEESAPGKVCRTFDELAQAIRNEDFDYEKVEAYVEHHFDYTDSHASDRVIDWVMLDQMPDDLKQAIADREAEMERIDRLLFDRAPLVIERDGFAVTDDDFIIREWTPEHGAVITNESFRDMRKKAEDAEKKRRKEANKSAGKKTVE